LSSLEEFSGIEDTSTFPSLDLDAGLGDESQMIPEWIKTNAGWWAQGKITDNEFVKGIQYLLSEGIMGLPQTFQTEASGSSDEIPSWIKNNAGWWAQGKITDDEFVKGIQYLVEQGIIRV